jgi:hypothetical protein
MPPPGLDRNAIDSLWDEYEPELPGATRDFEAGTYKADGWSVLLAHVTALGVRHPDFERIAAQFLTERGEIRTDRDELQRQRVHTLSETPALLAECRFALIRRPEDGPRFIINDKGYGRGRFRWA